MSFLSKKNSFSSGMSCIVAVVALTSVAYCAEGDSRVITIPTTPTAPTATPNPGVETTGTLTINQTIQFAAAASASTGNTITIRWDWGDSTPTSTGTRPTHRYLRPGRYTVGVTFTESNTNITFYRALTVTITDVIRTPRFRANFKYSEGTKDMMTLSGVLRVPVGEALANKDVLMDIGGILVNFTLDEKGSAKITTNANTVSGIIQPATDVDGSFKIFVKRRAPGVTYTDSRFLLVLKNGTLLPSLMDETAFNRDADKDPLSITTRITFVNVDAVGATSNGNSSILYQSNLGTTFISKQDQKGRLR